MNDLSHFEFTKYDDDFDDNDGKFVITIIIIHEMKPYKHNNYYLHVFHTIYI